MSIDKRHNPRFEFQLKITYVPDHFKQRLECKGRTRNISSSGIQITTDVGIPLDDKIAGSIMVPGEEEPIRFEAKLAWSKSRDVTENVAGYEFSKLTHYDLNRLKKIIRRVWLQMLTVYSD